MDFNFKVPALVTSQESLWRQSISNLSARKQEAELGNDFHFQYLLKAFSIFAESLSFHQVSEH